MMLTDLVFLVVFFAAVAALFAALWCAVRKEFGRARRMLFKLLVGGAVYMLVVIAASLLLPRQIVNIGDPQCFDDWCISVAGYKKLPEGNGARYRVDLQLSSRARRISQREKNMAVYLSDARGRRFDPVPGKSDVPLDVVLGPEESVVASRTFLVPGDAVEVGAVVTHEGGFPIGWFIIGYDSWFRKPPLVKLP